MTLQRCGRYNLGGGSRRRIQKKDEQEGEFLRKRRSRRTGTANSGAAATTASGVAATINRGKAAKTNSGSAATTDDHFFNSG